MGVFEKLPYLNYHDINLDWLVRQTKKNASDNTYLMKIFKWFQDQGLVGTVTNVTENPDDTVKIDYADFENNTTDDFTVYNKNGVDGLVSGAVSDAETYADTSIANAFKGLGDLPAETDLLDTDLLLVNRSGTAEAITGDVVAKQSDMDTAESNITTLQGSLSTFFGSLKLVLNGTAYTSDIVIPGQAHRCYLVKLGNWNSMEIGIVFPNNGNAPIIRTIAAYSNSPSLLTNAISANGTWGFKINVGSSIGLRFAVFELY